MKQSPSVRVGVVGAGIMGVDHARTIGRFVAHADLTMVADIDFSRARDAGEEFPRKKITTDPMELIGSPDVDAIIIASPDDTHAGLVLGALELRKPVLCEKPLATTVDDCLRILRVESGIICKDNSNRLVSVGFMRRFDPGLSEVRDRVEANDIGRPLVVHCVSRGVSPPPGATSQLSITGSAVHEFDIVPWLVGSPICEVAWFAPANHMADDVLQDPQVMILRTDSGTLATVEVFVGATYGYDIRCEVVGERGALELSPLARASASRYGQRCTGYASDWRGRFAEAYRLELQAWVDSVYHEWPSPLASARDGLVASAVADATIMSMKEGGSSRRVTVPN
jgi:myo-inositol 2-dehydrogenase / D-chiro-inositol 1-dehydrogenase